MKGEVTIVFPHQLYKDHPAIAEGRQVILIEEALYFNQYNFNKQKLILHRASMQFYLAYLAKKNITVTYIEANNTTSGVASLLAWLSIKKVSAIHYVDTVDFWLEKKLNKAADHHAISLQLGKTLFLVMIF